MIPSLRGPLVAAVVVIGLGVVVLVGTTAIAQAGGYSPVGPTAIPLVVGLAILVLGLLFLGRATIRPDRDLADRMAEEDRATHWPTPTLLGAALLGYAFALAPLGYILATAAFLPLTARIMGSARPRRDVAVGVGLAVVVYFGFTEGLGVRLPAGVLDSVLP
ncbi:MAG: tripartite tricarboxylate transporter TctB family protein [Chloroflexota bacterium]